MTTDAHAPVDEEDAERAEETLAELRVQWSRLDSLHADLAAEHDGLAPVVVEAAGENVQRAIRQLKAIVPEDD